MLIGLGQTFLPTSDTPTFSYKGAYYNGTTGTVKTYTVDIGTPSNDRVVVVCASQYSPWGNIAVTINGVSATYAVQVGTVDGLAIWYANVPTGESVTISVTHYGSINNQRIMVYSLYGLNSLTPLSASFGTSSGTAYVTVNNTQQGAILLYTSASRTNPGTITYNGVSTTKLAQAESDRVSMATGAVYINSVSGSLGSTYSGSIYENKVCMSIWR